MRRSVLLASAVVGVLAAPAAAHAAIEPQPLVSVAPMSTVFLDRVFSGPTTRQAASSAPVAYAAPDGQAVQVSFSPSYTPDPSIAQTYVDFLGSLPHGTELSQLKMYIATPAEVTQDCGGADGTLACYSQSTHTMTVPGQQVSGTTDGVTTSYVIAHEYGHHIAAFRTNAPFDTVDVGPKYWASEEQICLGTLSDKYFPGNEGRFYLQNPGEAWADTYAHLTYPAVAWQFDQSLAPSPASLAAATKDVTTPWTTNVSKTFTGTFAPTSANAQRFTFRLTLDGTMTVTLKGPKATDYDLALMSLGKVRYRTSTAGSQDTIKYASGVCRQKPAETITLSVSRKQGDGPFSVKVSYAG